jgi:molecular chaperone DnaJ
MTDSNINKDTTIQFQELNRAYEVLSDPNLKKMYDMFGESGIGTSAATDEVRTSAFERGAGRRRNQPSSMDPDIYDTYFSGNNRWTGGSGATNVGSAEGFGSRTGLHQFVGDDVCVDFEVDFMTSILGGEAEVIVRSLETCDACRGTGLREDTKGSPCGFCDGTGVVTKVTDSPLGRFQAEQQCTVCGGTGISPGNECARCDGKGSVEKTKAIKVTIPAGVDSGSKLQVCGEGDAGPNGGPAGDLYIFLKIKEDPVFRREGSDVYAEQTISCLDAMLGNTVRIPVVDGETTIDIPPGTQPGHTVCLKGSGAPSLIGQLNKRGDHYITINVEIPKANTDNANALTKILKEQAAALEDPKKSAGPLHSKTLAVDEQEAKTIQIGFEKLEDLRAKAAEAKTEKTLRLELEEVAETRRNEIHTLTKRLDELRTQLRAATESKEEFKEKLTQRDSKLRALAQRLGDIKSFIELDM